MFNRLSRFTILSQITKSFTSFTSKKFAMPSKYSKVTGGLVSFFLLNSFYKQYNSSCSEEYQKLILEGYDNMVDGEMRPFKYGTKDDDAILIVKYNGQYHALSNSCPHFGAPMDKGVLIDNVVKCPWHGAAFDIITGICDVSPSIDSLEKYQVTFKDGKLEVLLPVNAQKKAVLKMAKRDPTNPLKYLIIGGGPAALSAAETLRQMDFTGEIVILTEEDYIPYDRTGLSKWIPKSIDHIVLRSKDFLKQYDIDVHTNSKVVNVNEQNHTVSLEDNKEFKYDKLLIATGASPIIPPIKGTDLKGVYSLRNFKDLQTISQSSAQAKNVVIVGAGFIGLESASNLKKNFKDLNITVVDVSSAPFQAVLGNEIGKAVQDLHTQNGINFQMKKGISEISGDGKVQSVVLNDGTTIEADIVLLGTGVKPRTEFLDNKISIEKNHIKCDSFLGTSDPDIFAAGDVTSYPNLKTGERIYFAHYVASQQQGSIAAMNMLGKKVQYDYIPFFWTRFWDKSLQFVSVSGSFDEVFIDGNLFDLKFNAYYIKGENVVGFAAMNSPNAVNIVSEALRAGVMPKASLIKSGKQNIDTIKNRLRGIKIGCARANCLCAERKKKI